jgi:chromosome segregation and condensation protein ScpB
VNVLSSHRRTKRSGNAPAEVAAKAVVQILFATGKSLTVDGLREKLREFFREEVRAESRAVAALTNVELIAAIIECNQQLELVGLQLRIVNGVVSLLTTKIESGRLADYLRAQTGASGNPDLTTSALEVLACIAFKQPVSQAEIDQLFAADKRSLVVKLRDLRLITDFPGNDGRMRFATTGAFLLRFGLSSLEALHEMNSVKPLAG